MEALTACMKEIEFKTFTPTPAGATDAVETLWLLKQAGCTIGEMVGRSTLRKDFFGKGHEKGPRLQDDPRTEREMREPRKRGLFLVQNTQFFSNGSL